MSRRKIFEFICPRDDWKDCPNQHLPEHEHKLCWDIFNKYCVHCPICKITDITE